MDLLISVVESIGAFFNLKKHWQKLSKKKAADRSVSK